MYSGKKLKLIQRHLFCFDAQLMTQFALRRTLYAQYGFLHGDSRLAWNAKRMRAAGIRPHVGECDFLRRSLLEQKAIVGIEQEYGKSAVKQAFVDVGHEMA